MIQWFHIGLVSCFHHRMLLFWQWKEFPGGLQKKLFMNCSISHTLNCFYFIFHWRVHMMRQEKQSHVLPTTSSMKLIWGVWISGEQLSVSLESSFFLLSSTITCLSQVYLFISTPVSPPKFELMISNTQLLPSIMVINLA